MGELSYPEVGTTRSTTTLPRTGYRLSRVRSRLGTEANLVKAAGQAVLDWRMHRAVGVRIEAAGARAAPGVRVVVGLGVGPWRLRAPCEVVWAVREEDRVGFAYGTLTGHPECGEEAFVVERDPDGTVWLTVTAFSRPARWYTRAAGPVGRALQRAYARRCGTVLRRLVVTNGHKTP